MPNAIPQPSVFESSGFQHFQTDSHEKAAEAPRLFRHVIICAAVMFLANITSFLLPSASTALIVFEALGLAAAMGAVYLVYSGLKKQKGKLIYAAMGCTLYLVLESFVMVLVTSFAWLYTFDVDVPSYSDQCAKYKDGSDNHSDCEDMVKIVAGVSLWAFVAATILSVLQVMRTYRYNRLGKQTVSRLQHDKNAHNQFAPEYQNTDEYNEGYGAGASANPMQTEP